MYAKDFEYDGQALSDYNCIVCDFDISSGAVFAGAGSSITFNKTTRNYGRSNSLSGVQYDECFTATFDICKDPDGIFDGDIYFTSDECRDLMRWLNRGSFCKFRVLYAYDDIDTFYYNASFNVEKIKIGERICGLRLTMETDRPCAYGTEQKSTIEITNQKAAQDFIIRDISDDIGDTYLNLYIICKEDGDLSIYNADLDSTTLIRDCTKGEKITINGDILMITSDSDNNVCDRFNYVFPQITNSLENRLNHFSFSLPCTVGYTYIPIIKETF